MKRQNSQLFCSGDGRISCSRVEAFTIVELLVVIVVIGILAAVTIVSYSGISNQAIAAMLKSDLDNNSKLLKMYNVEYGYYPDSLGTDNCPDAPTINNTYCLKASKGVSLNYSGGGQNFVLTSTHTSSSKSFQVTEAGTSYAVTGNGNVSTFARSWNSAASNEDIGFAVDKTSDGGFVVAGSIYSDATTSYDCFVAKYTSDGVIAWAKKYTDPGYGQAKAIIQASDGGYALAGFADIDDNESADAFLVKLDSNGVVSWSKTWGRDGNDGANSVIQNPDGSFVIAGFSTSQNSENAAAFISKYDSSGNSLWSKSWGSDSEFYSVTSTNDGNYILIGDVYREPTSRDELVVKVSSDGDMIWAKTYSTVADELGYKIFQTADGGYLTIGGSGMYLNVIATKILSNGDVSWSKKITNNSNDNYGIGAVRAMDGSYLIVPSNETVLRLDGNGDTSWLSYLVVDNGSYIQIANSIAQLSDGGIVTAGFIGDVGNQRDVYTAKFRINGSIDNCVPQNYCGYFDNDYSSNQFNTVNESIDLVVPSYLVTGNATFTTVSITPTVTTIIAP